VFPFLLEAVTLPPPVNTPKSMAHGLLLALARYNVPGKPALKGSARDVELLYSLTDSVDFIHSVL
jgi:hypothetical protein